jgi:hypothetical protein
MDSYPHERALLIGASGGILGWYGSRFDLGAIVGVLLLARFRGRGQSVVGAFCFSLLALVSAKAGPRSLHASADLAQVGGAASAIWLCAFLASGRKPAATARAGDNVWESLLKLFPGWMWITRPDGTAAGAEATLAGTEATDISALLDQAKGRSPTSTRSCSMRTTS